MLSTHEQIERIREQAACQVFTQRELRTLAASNLSLAQRACWTGGARDYAQLAADLLLQAEQMGA